LIFAAKSARSASSDEVFVVVVVVVLVELLGAGVSAAIAEPIPSENRRVLATQALKIRDFEFICYLSGE
jgi:hypothetical protein